MMKFNSKGNLIPIGKNKIGHEEFLNFYSNHKSNTTRIALFSTFENIIRLFRENSKYDFQIWLGGSFITTKDKPKDIDAVFFLNSNDYDENIEAIKYIYENKESLKMDIDFKRFTVDSNDTYNQNSIRELENLFFNDRISEEGNVEQKGFIEILIKV